MYIRNILGGMGVVSSQEFQQKRFLTPSSMRRFSNSEKLSKSEQLERKYEIIQNVQTEIDLFAGDRSSQRYSQIQETLTSISKDFQEAKNNTSKQKIRNKCDQALTEIQKCIQRLETRVNFNEQHLDSAAVESHSFIHSFHPPQPSTPLQETTPISKSTSNYEQSGTLERLENDTRKLEQDVKLSIQLDDVREFGSLERKVQMLYTDLEMVVVDNDTPLSKYKAAIGKRLIKCNNQMKKYKRISVLGKQTIIARIERKLENLEIETLTYNGLKNENKYKELKNELEGHLNNLCQIEEIDENREKFSMIEKIKNTLKELDHRAEENRKQFEANELLTEFQERLRVLKEKIKESTIVDIKVEYIQIDQELRRIWARISEIDDTTGNLHRSKENTINDVQKLLKYLNDKAKSFENHELARIKEFQNFWNQLNYDLDVQKIDSKDSKSITDILKKISEEINRKTNALETKERRKSTSNMVVTKILHLEDASKSQTSLINIPIQSDIKVQPNVNIISEIHRIESEVKSISNEIKQLNGVQINGNQLNHFRKQLERCESTLKKVEHQDNTTIDSNKKRVLKALEEAYCILREGTDQPHRTSKVCEVMDIHTEIQYFREQIKIFKGTTKDKSYEKIKQGLAECLRKLQLIDEEHPIKQEGIQQIQQYHQELESKLAENQARVKIDEKNIELKRKISQETKNVIEKVQKLKSQIEKFSGVCEGLQYKQLEEELHSCTVKLEDIDTVGDERLENARIQTKQKIRNYIKILKEKSTKNEIVQEIRKSQNLDAPHIRINALRDELVKIKKKTETFKGKYKDEEYLTIERDLLTRLEELKLIDDQGHKSVADSKQQYKDYIIKLLAYFEDKTKMSEVESHSDNDTITDPIKEMSFIESEISALKSKIGQPNKGLKQLKQDAISLRQHLREIKVSNVTGVVELKRQLQDRLDECVRIYEEKEIEEIVEKVKIISISILNFNGTRGDQEYCRLDEALIQSMLDLNNINCSNSLLLNNAKSNAIQLIQKNINILNGRAKDLPGYNRNRGPAAFSLHK
ncbi:hypothetical protein FQA39_LY17061 [Lamprigera yunnana]|nr:hypothetical protein FQA39_LY17061 [Lamprigera yunnana]